MAVLKSLLLGLLALWSSARLVSATDFYDYGNTDWTSGAHATYYGGQDASGTMGGSCGYTNLYSQGYGTNTCALSDSLLNNDYSCGACFEIRCVDSPNCFSGTSVVVTATNNCPHGSYGGWCDGDNLHFDMAFPAFTQVANWEAGNFPVSFRRVSCTKQGGVQFLLGGNPWYLSVLVLNVGGPGNVHSLYCQTPNTGWLQMTHTWGQTYTLVSSYSGQPLSFQVTAGDGVQQQTLDFPSVIPSSWSEGQTYEGSSNFIWK